MLTTRAPGEATAPPEQVLIQMLTGMWLMQAVATAARLGIPDRLATGEPQTSADLAAGLGVHAGALRRLMRALASVGVFSEVGPDRYQLTPIGERLQAGRPGSLGDFFIAEVDRLHWHSWEHLVDAVRTGEPRPQAVFGMPAFDYYSQHPEAGEQFGRAMKNGSDVAAHGVLENYDFARARLVVDVGGGNGSMTLAILNRHPNVQGIVADLPYIEAQARETIAAAGLSERCRFEPTNFFEAVPAGADIYLLKFILHDWKDEEAVKVLRSCRAAIAPQGRLVVVEMLVPENNEPGFVQLMDLNMLVMTGGMERTPSEYDALFQQAGFRLTRAIPTGTPFSVIEAEPFS